LFHLDVIIVTGQPFNCCVHCFILL